MNKSNFFILNDYHLISLGIPKCGQTSIKRAFLGNDIYNVHDKAHLDYLPNETYQECVKELRSMGFLSFTFVRNPYDRILSFWSQKVAVPNKFTDFSKVFKQGEPFSKTVETICNIPDSKSNVHYKSQTSMIMVYDELPDFVGRIERFLPDWAELEQVVGRKLPRLPWENRTNSHQHGHYWTPRLKQMVYERYKQDFEILGYNR